MGNFFLGVMVAWTAPLVILAVLLLRVPKVEGGNNKLMPRRPTVHGTP